MFHSPPRKPAGPWLSRSRRCFPIGSRDGNRTDGGVVSFDFDSDGRSVWVVAVFGKGAPPTLRTVSDAEVPWASLDDEHEEDGDEENQDKD